MASCVENQLCVMLGLVADVGIFIPMHRRYKVFFQVWQRFHSNEKYFIDYENEYRKYSGECKSICLYAEVQRRTGVEG